MPSVYVILVVPVVPPEMAPPASTVAMPVLPEVHVPPALVSLKVVVAFRHTLVAPEMLPGEALTVTTALTELPDTL